MKKELSIECKEIFERISEFIDGEADPEVCEQIHSHMTGCADCDNFIDSVKKTVELYRKDKAPMPEDVKSRLHSVLEEKCREMKKHM